MAQVISATARARARSGNAVKRDRFLSQAADLLAEACSLAAAGSMDQALESAYRSALRTAGARIQASPVARRRRLPSSAWAQLALVGDVDKEWAKEGQSFSRVRSRVATGLDPVPADDVVYSLLDLASRFLDATEAEVTFGDMAA